MGKLENEEPRRAQPPSSGLRLAVLFGCLCFASLPLLVHHLSSLNPSVLAPPASPSQPPCRPPLPRLLLRSPPSPSHPALLRACSTLSSFLSSKLALPDVDSLVVGVVAPNGSLYEWTGGRKRANESDGDEGELDRQSVYRIGSVSKLFTMVEVLVLQQKGALKLDDPITNFYPNFTYVPFGAYPESYPNPDAEPITLRLLASHMSGIARDIPPITDPSNLPTVPDMLEAVSRTPLVAPPWTLPVYSNTGWALLGGVAVVAANNKSRAEGEKEVESWAELLERDVLHPLGMNGSSFRVTDANRGQVVVPAVDPWMADFDLGDANPTGGQYSSLADLTKVLQSFLDPSLPGSVLSAYTLREWMRPAHPYWDEWSEVGLAWEIAKVEDSWGRQRRVYQKWGNINTIHASFSVNPDSSFGLIVLNTGLAPQTFAVTFFALDVFQKAFDEVLAEEVSNAYAGIWSVEVLGNKTLSLRVWLEDGSMWTDRPSFFEELGHARRSEELAGLYPVQLWWIGNEDFRIADVYPGFEGGCFGQWAELDQQGYKNGYPINLVRFEGVGEARRLSIPALELSFARVV